MKSTRVGNKADQRREMTPEALEMVAARFRVLADPMRLRLLQNLETGEMSVSELTALVASTQPNVSKHLKTLQDAGLLGRRQEGNTVYYSIADSTVFELCEVVCHSIQQRLTAQAGIFSGPPPRPNRRRA